MSQLHLLRLEKEQNTKAQVDYLYDMLLPLDGLIKRDGFFRYEKTGYTMALKKIG